MNNIQIFNLASRFRSAIMDAKNDEAFPSNCRMSNFPIGCCDDTADLFAHFLYHEHGTISIRVDASYHDGNPENNSSHSWQEIAGTVIDLTGSQPQFRYNPSFLNYDRDIYVGPMDDFHSMFKINREFRSCGIESLGQACHERMYRLYGIIMSHYK